MLVFEGISHKIRLLHSLAIIERTHAVINFGRYNISNLQLFGWTIASRSSLIRKLKRGVAGLLLSWLLCSIDCGGKICKEITTSHSFELSLENSWTLKTILSV